MWLFPVKRERYMVMIQGSGTYRRRIKVSYCYRLSQLYEKFISSLLFLSPLVSSNLTKEKSLPNCHIQYRRLSMLLLISITLVSSSSLYLLPLSYSQEFYIVSSWGEFGTGEGKLLWPSGIALDQEGNVYV